MCVIYLVEKCEKMYIIFHIKRKSTINPYACVHTTWIKNEMSLKVSIKLQNFLVDAITHIIHTYTHIRQYKFKKIINMM